MPKPSPPNPIEKRPNGPNPICMPFPPPKKLLKKPPSGGSSRRPSGRCSGSSLCPCSAFADARAEASLDGAEALGNSFWSRFRNACRLRVSAPPYTGTILSTEITEWQMGHVWLCRIHWENAKTGENERKETWKEKTGKRRTSRMHSQQNMWPHMVTTGSTGWSRQMAQLNCGSPASLLVSPVSRPPSPLPVFCAPPLGHSITPPLPNVYEYDVLWFMEQRKTKRRKFFFYCFLCVEEAVSCASAMPKKGKSAAVEEFELFCESKGLNGLRNGRKVRRKQKRR